MGSGLEEYWDGVDGPAKRQVAVECSLVFWHRWCLFLSLMLK